MKRSVFLRLFALLPFVSLITPKTTIRKGDIVKWNDWAAYPSRRNWVRLSVVTCVWNDGTVLLDDQRGIHSSELQVVGHCDSITASGGLIHDSALKT